MQMNTAAAELFDPLFQSGSFHALCHSLKNKPLQKIQLSGLAGSAASVIIAGCASQDECIHVVIAPGREEAMSMFDDLEALMASGSTKIQKQPVYFFPTSWRRDLSVQEDDSRHLLLRAEVLRALASNQPAIIVTWPAALIQLVPHAASLSEQSLKLHSGEKVDLGFIEDVLTGYGFRLADFVSEPGEFAIRGGICDVYSFADENPFRINFLGDQVQSIRSFNPSTQLTIGHFDHVTILPDISLIVDPAGLVTFFSLTGSEPVYWISDPSVHQRLREDRIRIHQSRPELPLIEVEVSFDLNIPGARQVFTFPSQAEQKNAENIAFQFTPQPVINRRFDWLTEELFRQIGSGWKAFLIAESASQLERLHSIIRDIEEQKRITVTEKLGLVKFSLNEGFVSEDLKLAVYTDHQLFNRYKRSALHDRFSRPERLSVNELMNLSPGDYVVHINHGIGRYAGLQKVMVNGQEQEAIRLLYKDDDELLVSIHALHRISKYVGRDGSPPSIDRIGGSSWTNRKNKAKKKVKDIARGLITLYAKRRAAKGFPFSPDNYLQYELEASFIWEDTPDQITATEAIKKDMEAPCPMDRLVCGDVGFGKTELAVRAAFKAVADSRQVALLVPTTILAYQHYNTFSERLNGLPARVEYLNRFRSAKEQKQVLEDLKKGRVDILIGTHRILSKDVEFKSLGLLIVDEEQKFGVSAKEKLRNIKENVDTLTLTATPIPRTLQFSLMGARDMSVLRTPPPNRYPVQTEVMTFNPEVICDAITQEINRGGQVYFVHNRIQNLQDIATLIRNLVPEARVDVGHGQMPGDEMEKVMLRFVAGETDVFVSTTIVESGLDVPNANTMIINDAQNFGLSDLHQLRGRVGRSNRKAFCYLFTPPETILSDESRKRLRAIAEFSDLGSGFQIAMRDLDIRGAGNILGGEQSGFIAEIGFEMYQKILDEALAELRMEEPQSVAEDSSGVPAGFVHDVVIETDVSIMIPDDYVPAVSERLILYKELNELTSEKQLEEFLFRLNDRFGSIPRPVSELAGAVRLKWLAKSMAIEKLILKSGLLTLYFTQRRESPFFSSATFQKIINFTVMNPRRCLMKEQHERLVMKVDQINSVVSAIEIMTLMTTGQAPE